MANNPFLVDLLVYNPENPATTIQDHRSLDLSKQDHLNEIVNLFKTHGYLHLQGACFNPLDPGHQSKENANHPCIHAIINATYPHRTLIDAASLSEVPSTKDDNTVKESTIGMNAYYIGGSTPAEPPEKLTWTTHVMPFKGRHAHPIQLASGDIFLRLPSLEIQTLRPKPGYNVTKGRQLLVRWRPPISMAQSFGQG